MSAPSKDANESAVQTSRYTPPLPLRRNVRSSTYGGQTAGTSGGKLDKSTRSLIAALGAAAALLAATLYWAQKEAAAEEIRVRDVLWRLLAPASAGRRPAVSLTMAEASAAAAREAARIEYEVEQQLRAALPSRVAAIESAISFNRKHPGAAGGGRAGAEVLEAKPGDDDPLSDPLSDALLGLNGDPGSEAASSGAGDSRADADAAEMPALTMLPTVVLSLEGLLLDRAWHPKGYVTALRPRVAEGILALAETGCEIVLWSRQRDADAARLLFEAHVLPAIMAVDRYRYMAFEQHMRRTAREKYFELAGTYDGEKYTHM